MFRVILSALLLVVAFPSHARQDVPQTSDWPFVESDLPADPGFRYGTLENGMRFIIRSNGTPAGQAMVQFWIDAGSMAENEDELGYAHFVEHMAFNGSTNVPEGEMVRLLEREGLAFGADTNASTGLDTTRYRLDLPRNDLELLDIALMLMRETASELSFTPEAVEREKGVVLSEMRVRDTYARRNNVDQIEFFYPDARFTHRFPVGTEESLQNATAEGLRGLWQRLYRPDNSAIIVIGDFDTGQVEAAIRHHFADWKGAQEVPLPFPGPVDTELQELTDIYVDPALAEQLTVSRHAPPIDMTDTIANRQRNLLAEIGYRIINRRFQSLARDEYPSFRSARVGTSDIFRAGRTTSLVVNAADGEWQGGLAEAQIGLRMAIEFGFTEAEVAEQVARVRTQLENAVASADTRSNRSLAALAVSLLKDEQIPTTPASTLARFEAFAPQITPETVHAAMLGELVPLENPLIRFAGRTAPEGGEMALREAWEMGMNVRLEEDVEEDLPEFTYTEFGEPGTIVSDSVEPVLGIRTITFENGLKLNLKPTDLQRDRIAVQLSIDGGKLLDTADNPLATAMVSVLPIGGLGKHSYDELQSILAGRSVSFSIRALEDRFRMSGTTTRRDAELQLQVMAATLSDPGYRPQGEIQYRRNVENFFASLNATPERALNNGLGEILSDDDPRFTLQPEADFLALNFEKLREDIGDQLSNGALELAIVGDFDAETIIDAVARTLGALPAREADFGSYEQARRRAFTSDRIVHVLRHEGSSNQARLALIWPTRDDSDLLEHIELELLERIMRIELTEKLREELGQVYSISVNATQSRTYDDYGTFSVAASVDSGQVDTARSAILATMQQLIAQPVLEDVITRARRPLLEAYDNALKTNGGWMNLANRSQSELHRLERFSEGKAILEALTVEDIRMIAQRYLVPDEQVEILVLPQEE